jgi:hypothetical protein
VHPLKVTVMTSTTALFGAVTCVLCVAVASAGYETVGAGRAIRALEGPSLVILLAHKR